jgi:crotonobetainyl-CoA:carnitine CoA-transferase CaiB-like acyl-CoA transferase
VATPIYTADQMVADPHVVERKLHFEVPHRTVGKVPLVASPMRLSETPVDVYAAPPEIGQNTDEVLAAIGYSAEERTKLRTSEII